MDPCVSIISALYCGRRSNSGAWLVYAFQVMLVNVRPKFLWVVVVHFIFVPASKYAVLVDACLLARMARVMPYSHTVRPTQRHHQSPH